jgi:ABC-type antimicrobial peptide transport system ATPase subunit
MQSDVYLRNSLNIIGQQYFLKVPYLEPLLFIIFINDIVNEINAEIKLFADDTSLYLIVDNPNDTAFLLNQDLNQLQRWSEKWLVKFNRNKTESMVISSKRNKPHHPLYK